MKRWGTGENVLLSVSVCRESRQLLEMPAGPAPHMGCILGASLYPSAHQLLYGIPRCPAPSPKAPASSLPSLSHLWPRGSPRPHLSTLGHESNSRLALAAPSPAPRGPCWWARSYPLSGDKGAVGYSSHTFALQQVGSEGGTWQLTSVEKGQPLPDDHMFKGGHTLSLGVSQPIESCETALPNRGQRVCRGPDMCHPELPTEMDSEWWDASCSPFSWRTRLSGREDSEEKPHTSHTHSPPEAWGLQGLLELRVMARISITQVFKLESNIQLLIFRKYCYYRQWLYFNT